MMFKTLVEIFEKNLQVKVKHKQYLRPCRDYQFVKLEIWKTEVLIEDIEKVTSPKQHL